MLNYINFEHDFTVEEKGKIELRGKADKLSLYGVKPAANKM